MKEEGKFTASVTMANVLCSFINLIANSISGYFQAKVGQKKTLTGGLFFMSCCHFLVVLFYILDSTYGILSMICLFIISFQASIGPCAYQHIQETCHDSMVGFLNLTLFSAAIVSGYTTSFVKNNLDIASMFVMYGAIVFVGFVYVGCFTKDTTFQTVEVTLSNLSRSNSNASQQ